MKYKAIILTESIDSHGDKILIHGVNIKNGNVPITENFNLEKIVGIADNFKKENDKLICDIEISDKYKYLTPAISFRCIENHIENGIFIHDKIEIV